MKQRIPEPTHVLPLELDIERIHHELAVAFDLVARDALQRTGLVTGAHAVFCTLDHGHFLVDLDGIRAVAGIRGFSDIGIRNRYRRSGWCRCLADIRENRTHTSAAFMCDTP